jgi:hypothetical protein
MRAELVLGFWLILCGVLGGVRAVLKYSRDPTERSWFIEGVLSVGAWGVGLILVVHAFAGWVNR